MAKEGQKRMAKKGVIIRMGVGEPTMGVGKPTMDDDSDGFGSMNLPTKEKSEYEKGKHHHPDDDY